MTTAEEERRQRFLRDLSEGSVFRLFFYREFWRGRSFWARLYPEDDDEARGQRPPSRPILPQWKLRIWPLVIAMGLAPLTVEFFRHVPGALALWADWLSQVMMVMRWLAAVVGIAAG